MGPDDPDGHTDDQDGHHREQGNRSLHDPPPGELSIQVHRSSSTDCSTSDVGLGVAARAQTVSTSARARVAGSRRRAAQPSKSEEEVGSAATTREAKPASGSVPE
jgi:hypothetical protein